jgi:uncharacterized protein (TIGR00369 family)
MSATTPDRESILAFFKDVNLMPPVTAHLGFQPIDYNPDTMTLECQFTAKPEFLNPNGSVQGGIVTAFLDEAMSGALFVAAGMGSIVPTLEMKTGFLRPLKTEKARAIGRVLKIGRSFGFLEGELFNEDGVLCATATATSIVRRIEA